MNHNDYRLCMGVGFSGGGMRCWPILGLASPHNRDPLASKFAMIGPNLVSCSTSNPGSSCFFCNFTCLNLQKLARLMHVDVGFAILEPNMQWITEI